MTSPDASVTRRDENEPMYPCIRCGKCRTKAEGGTTFTVCDTCWDATMKPNAISPTPETSGGEDEQEVGWLIESDNPVADRRWWNGDLWTADSLKAVRFPRASDAQAVIDSINRMMHTFGGGLYLRAHPTEHVWFGGNAVLREWAEWTATTLLRNDLTLRQMADRCEVSPATVLCWLRGKNAPHPLLRESLASRLSPPSSSGEEARSASEDTGKNGE
jgi:hypothetical protein